MTDTVAPYAGGRFVRRDGKVTGRMVHNEGSNEWPWHDPQYDEYYHANGTWSFLSGSDPRDIVSTVLDKTPKSAITESISDADQSRVRSAIARRADEARITGFASAALAATLLANQTVINGQTASIIAWATADAMEAEWQKRFGQ